MGRFGRFTLRVLLSLSLVWPGNFLPAAAGAQSLPSSLPAAQAQGTPPYRLAPGDVLSISVWGYPDLAAVVEVRPDGYVSFPLAGDVLAWGLTPPELSLALADRLRQYVKDPKVTTIIQQFRTIRVSIMGAVRNPGTYALRFDARIPELLGRSGGALEEADLAGAVLTRSTADQGTTTLSVDLEAVLRGDSPQASMRLEDGDVLFVPTARPALILGAVQSPGAYPVRPGMRLLDLLAAAGGFSREADVSRVTLTRQGQTTLLPIRLRDAAPEAAGPLQEPVRAGDLVYVPPARQVIVIGAVRAPGAYSYAAGLTLLDAVGLAGGVDRQRASGWVTVSRVSGGPGPAGSPLKLSLEALLAGVDPQANPALAPGDVVAVEEAPQEVAVLGEVKAPGAVAYRPGLTVVEALAKAGGVTEQADLGQVVLTRRGPGGEREVLRLDLRALRATGGEGEQGEALRTELRAGDLVVVPRARLEVAVLGAVVRPGAYGLRGGERLVDVLAMAGGPTDEALLSQAVFTPAARRAASSDELGPGGGQGAQVGGSARAAPDAVALEQAGAREGMRVVDLRAALENPGHPDNLEIREGGVLYVPRRLARVTVLGEVARPGSYPFLAGMRVLDALAAAGGLLETADRQNISLLRAAPVVLDYDRMVQSLGDEAGNPSLEAGDVLVVGRAERRVLVLGAVTRPGALTYAEGLRLLDAVAMAGGPTTRSDLAHVTLTRSSGETVEVDLAEVLRQPGSDANARLLAGDVVFVPEIREVLVLGAVARPGSYVPPTGARVLDVLALAGGVRAEAGVSSVLVTRRGPDGASAVYPLDYGELVASPEKAVNLPVAGGDVVYVPEGRRHVLVLGQVRNPGLYSLPVGGPVRLLDVLAMAGGPTPRATLQSVGILRSEGEREQARAGQGARLFQGPAEQNPEVKPGDVVYVPETRWPDWRDVFGFVSGINTFVELLQKLQ